MDKPEQINIEIACTKGFNKKLPHSDLQQAIHLYLAENKNIVKDHVFHVNYAHVESIMVCDEITEMTPRTNLCLYTYLLSEGTGEEETVQQDGDEVQVSNHWLLPAREFHGLWESLIYEDDLKENLLSFVQTTMLFSKKMVNVNLVACNRLILLHGPPGTGKTSLCKALAQKLAIRMTNHYTHAHLIEINSHSLFSKWFSESGKLVQKVFGQIHDLCQDRSSLVCVLVDEVESIAFARESISNNEPSDSIRVVNAVLTQLDRIRKYPNVFVLATSNLTTSIDIAFLDRADIVQFIGNPTVAAIYEIYRSALEDLQNVDIIKDAEALPTYLEANVDTVVSNNMKIVSELSLGLSGRSLRKVPFLAHALFVKQEETTLLKFLSAMRNAIRRMQNDKRMLGAEKRPSSIPNADSSACESSTSRGVDSGVVSM
ncbi:pachytene checkpoint protein 2 homolog [Toxorhynchites rutilus septentrionalis]|uniref:pachytene checkpoint protein 2 homolog n=1 Tax=Toxorhynchites rutilus septentrionalis TaxID=329112 RepID=UPI0024792018|nr:pachytene checkpoint protein 2 homolog [Toxorhynchites rutilus septentrionalis]